MKILDKKIILASKSPRRKQLLAEAGFTFEIKTKDVEESYPADMPVRDVAPFLAEKKAMASVDIINEEEILLAADSVVILENEIFEKPKDVEDAKRILRRLSGNIHQVITGVCLISKKEKRVFSGVSEVHFQPLTEEEIEYYITNYKPFDKAGAYAIQEWIGHCKISKIEGTYSNIMGLPMELVFRNLAEMT
ncbi:MAG: septum formation protein [Paraglaciecola sp.]|jgi:septum formation protein